MVTRLQIAKGDIVSSLDSISLETGNIYRLTDFDKILNENRQFWRLTKSLTTRKFIAYLIEASHLRQVQLKFPARTETRYIWREASVYQVAQTLRPECYFSHYTAMKLHGLTEQMPKDIYVNSEQTPKPQPAGGLRQDRIDFAFSSNPRLTNNFAVYGDLRIVLLSGKHTGCLGVEKLEYSSGGQRKGEILRVTGLERTLIDCAVRPSYSGGIYEVQKAFDNAVDKISTNRLVATLKKLNHIYPYHQAIGYYLERAGAGGASLDLLRSIPMEFDFYLAQKMQETRYIKEWRLHVPADF